ncbi:hypothetical protein [Methanothermobacter sp. THM-2]|uniref:hypothetical protein n=1 Tax=Methanothermobacter sp. THM-2 TaxID=2606912 RepID=UPI001366641F|nr:hypothetical protein [Methanothermobacter sp. THM-2]QHN07326.1 hypothetical protein FZP68_00110 [Methanothermobacter sp. THM-2]
MIDRIKYSLKIAVILAVLGSAVLFIWGMIGRMSVDWEVLRSALEGFVAFGIFGFILGFLIYDLEP